MAKAFAFGNALLEDVKVRGKEVLDFSVKFNERELLE
jgi:hypothetical protein